MIITNITVHYCVYYEYCSDLYILVYISTKRLCLLHVDSRLDRETRSLYSFDAIATDSCAYGPRSQSVRVDINIVDINDNPPRFSQHVYSADVSLDIAVHSTVTSVVATDRDQGLNARVTYSLDDTHFQVRPLTTLCYISMLSMLVQTLCECKAQIPLG